MSNFTKYKEKMTCLYCGKETTRKVIHQKFCCIACKRLYRYKINGNCNPSKIYKYKYQYKFTHQARKYGITINDYKKIFKEQDGKCKICGKMEARKRKDGELYNLHIDHDHKTLEVRGLLCNRCNICLGLVHDDIELFNKMIDYLEETKNRVSQ